MVAEKTIPFAAALASCQRERSGAMEGRSVTASIGFTSCAEEPEVGALTNRLTIPRFFNARGWEVETYDEK